jgi:hypothetical protein
MFLMATTRSTLRTSLQYKSDGRLTGSTDQDYYLNLAELRVIGDWALFDEDVFAKGRQSATSDADGILLVPATFMELFMLEDANKRPYPRIELEERWNASGWYPAGYDATNKKRKLQLMLNGAVDASRTMYFYDSEVVQMGSGTDAEPVFPEEYRDLIALKAAQLFFEDQGNAFDQAALVREQRYLRLLASAKKMYRRLSRGPRYAPSNDPDAGEGGGYTIRNA